MSVEDYMPLEEDLQCIKQNAPPEAGPVLDLLWAAREACPATREGRGMFITCLSQTLISYVCSAPGLSVVERIDLINLTRTQLVILLSQLRELYDENIGEWLAHQARGAGN